MHCHWPKLDYHSHGSGATSTAVNCRAVHVCNDVQTCFYTRSYVMMQMS